MDIINLTGEPIESEFNPKHNYSEIFEKHDFWMGRMIGGSKTTYRNSHPKDNIIFNANIITKLSGKVWYGDLNVTLDFDKLRDVADELKEDLFILSEMDARFENENKPITELIKKAKIIINSKI
jgi:hypothetical protein